MCQQVWDAGGLGSKPGPRVRWASGLMCARRAASSVLGEHSVDWATSLFLIHVFFFCGFYYCFVLWDRPYYIVPTGLELKNLPASASKVLGLTTGITIISLFLSLENTFPWSYTLNVCTGGRNLSFGHCTTVVLKLEEQWYSVESLYKTSKTWGLLTLSHRIRRSSSSDRVHPLLWNSSTVAHGLQGTRVQNR